MPTNPADSPILCTLYGSDAMRPCVEVISFAGVAGTLTRSATGALR
jgi:hypothetical protein